jgi:hypothetical protein
MRSLKATRWKSQIGMKLLEEEDGRNELMNSVAAPAQIMLQISSARWRHGNVLVSGNDTLTRFSSGSGFIDEQRPCHWWRRPPKHTGWTMSSAAAAEAHLMAKSVVTAAEAHFNTSLLSTFQRSWLPS